MHESPARATVTHREPRRACHRTRVIVLDDEDVGVTAEHPSELTHAGGVERRAGRVLRPRRQDERRDTGAERTREVVGHGARLVDRHGLGDEAERGKAWCGADRADSHWKEEPGEPKKYPEPN